MFCQTSGELTPSAFIYYMVCVQTNAIGGCMFDKRKTQYQQIVLHCGAFMFVAFSN